MTTRLFVVHLKPFLVDAASELLREAGFGDIVEGEVDGRVRLSTALRRGADDTAAGARFVDACRARGLVVETSWEELADDWQLAWTRYLEPVRIDASLTLVPGASPSPRVPGELYLEPGLTFGFGEHPTTRMALRFLASRVEGQRVLDVGTGSGVLALAAAHFGAQHATGIDIDPACVEAAKQNARTNDLAVRCTFSTAQLGRLESDFGVVVANIDAQTLRAMRQALWDRVGERGCLGLTGVLVEQEQSIIDAFAELGVGLFRLDVEGEWVLLGTRA